MAELPFPDRVTAGKALAAELEPWRGRADPLVLALPRGGVPVAYEVADAIDAALDLIIVRKLGTPGQRELAMGAIASGGIRVLNDDVIRALDISSDTIERVAAEELAELERREQAYRGDRPRPRYADRTLILVDDGIATGASMRAAIAALRTQAPQSIVVAVPVAPPDTVARLRGEADEVVCLETPQAFGAIGRFYRSFPQLTDEEVCELLARAWEEPSAGSV